MQKFNLGTPVQVGLTWALHTQKNYQAPSTKSDDEKWETQMSTSTLGRHKVWAIYHLEQTQGT